LIHILHGADSFSRAERLRSLKAELDADGSLESNTVEFDARQATPAEVLAACNTIPFLGGRRLVVLAGALSQASGTGGRRTRRKQAEPEGEERGPWWALVDGAREMPETTVLVLVDSEGIDQPLVDALTPFATVETFSLPGPRDIAGWVQNRARQRGLQIDARACSVIADLIGEDTWLLASEIEKLAAYAASGRVTEHDVRVLVPDIRDSQGFLLADAVAERKPAEATRLLQRLLTRGEHPAPVLLLTIENRYRRLAVAREMMDGRATSAQIGSKVGMSGYGLERILDQASRLSMDQVRWSLDRIAQSDQDVKEGLLDEKVSLELLVNDLAAAPGRAQNQRVSAAAVSS
jgi:DNA polymerase-3 subunit delta